MTDGLHQVGLAHADATVEEERVVGLRGMLADSARRSMSKLIAGAGDEIVEGVLGIKLSGAVPIEALLLRRSSHGSLRMDWRFAVYGIRVDCLALGLRLWFGDELDVEKFQAEVFHGLAD